MHVLEVLQNAEAKAVRVAGRYKSLLVVVKIFDGVDRSIKFYEKPERYEMVKSRWNTNRPVDDPKRRSEYAALATEYLECILGKL